MGYTIPEGVDTMLDVVGVGWPNVDEDAYRDMAKELREFAEDADDDAHAAHKHVQQLLSSGSSESLTALEKHWQKVLRKNKDLAQAARIIAGALDRIADIIVARKIAAVGELADLCATVGIALAAAPFTFGLTTLLAGGKIAITRAAFKAILKEMAEAAVAEITAVLTQPAVAALESIVTDLVIQTTMNVTGQQDGIDVDRAMQAGKDGLQLNSAGGPTAPGPGGGPVIDHDAHSNTGGKLANVQVSMQTRAAGKIGKAKGHHGRAKGRDSLTAALDGVLDGVFEKLTKGHDHIGKHVGKDLPDAIGQGSKIHRGKDQEARDNVNKVNSSGPGDADGLGGRRGDSGGPARKNPDDTRTKPASLEDAKGDARGNSIPPERRTCATDPVDVATGTMLLPHTDLMLPGTLPLVVRRVHLSGYRHGHWFGRSWASTLDERIELDARGQGALWAREDGTVLVYPELPAPGDTGGVLPLEGDPLPLAFGGADEDVRTYTVTDPRTGLIRTFTGSPYWASSAFWLTEIEDRNGNGITFHRGSDGSPDRIVHDGGYRIAVTVRDARVTRLALRSPDGPVAVMGYGYDGDGNLDAVTNSSGLPLRFTYDAEARITSWTDRNNSTYQYVYDAAGRVMRTVGPDGFLSSVFSYAEDPESGGGTTRYTDSLGATTVYRCSARLQVVAETSPLGHTTLTEYGADDRLLAVTDALGHTTRYERDGHGNLTALIAPDGVRTTAVYDLLHRPVEVTERGGRTRRFRYDERGNLVEAVDVSGARTVYEYSGRGHVNRIRDPLGNVTELVTNAAGLPERVCDSRGATVTCERDAFGRITSVTDPLGGMVRQGWTTEGRLAWRELPDGTREEWVRDGEGNTVAHTDRMGRRTVHAVTHFDQPSSTRTSGASYSFSHDTELRLTRVTNAQGLAWHYTYDAVGRLISETDFDGRTLVYEHDALGRITRRTNAVGQSLTFERDVLGRVTALRHGDGTGSTYTYDATGHVSRITNGDAEIVLERDRSGRIVSETVNGRTLSRAYDALGRRTHRRTPSGAHSELSYTATGLAAYTAGDHSFRFERDLLGRETSRTLDDQLTLTQAWDPVGRLTGHTLTAAGSRIVERTYAYQADGMPVAVDDTLAGRQLFELDSAGRITGVQARGWSEQYAYTASGDQARTSLPGAAPGQDSAGPRVYDGTRVTRAGRTVYTYDLQGRVILRRTTTLSGKQLTWRFTWDAEDRLRHVDAPGNTRWRYLYDALGRRISKQRLGSDGQHTESVEYCWDGAQLAEQYTGGTTLVWDYLGGQPLSQRESKHAAGDRQHEVDRRFFAIVTGLSGGPSELVSPQGDIGWRARSTVWGATQWARNSTAYIPLRCPGQYYDAETGLHYNFNRYYDPDLGRYISPDPLGIVPSVNHYAYVSNPFAFSDPLGLAGCEADPTWGGRVRWSLDRHGRPYEMTAIITRDMLNEGTSARESIRPPGYQSGRGQARGHMLANQLGGSGDHPNNLFTISQNPTNTPEMSMFEQEVYDAVDRGEIVTYNVYLEYVNDDPDSPPKYIQLEASGHRRDADGNLLFDIEDFLTNPAHDEPRPRRP
ncbi:RHS repeat-associated core domain-containing protein [Streptomyces tsukubensis]